MPKAEGFTLSFDGPLSIRTNLLETFPYEGPSQKITYTTDEFSAVCPFSGLPDLGTIEIEYVPRKKIVELKSLKYYFISFRNIGIYQEHATARIYQDLKTCLETESLQVTLTYKTRGGINTVTRCPA